MTVYRADRITITISSDEMSALLSISSQGSEFPTVAEIETALADAGVKIGVNHHTIQIVHENQDPVHELIIAEGEDIIDGKADELVWAIDIAEKNRPKISVDGKADYKILNQFKAVNKNDEIVSLLPGSPARAGSTVTGKALEIDQLAPLRIPTGKNTWCSADGLTLFAAIDGVALMKRGEVVIDNVYHIHGDVDFSTGNVKYNGTVMVDGDVRSGFRVEATDSIYIHGSVEAAEIYSKNGSIIIQNGVLGRQRARILAGDDLNCGFMQDATASVKNDVVIKHYAINSNITSGGRIMLIENEGLLRGGKTVAEKGIECLIAGSERNILTEMVLTRSDMGEEESKLWQSKIRLAEEYQKLDSLLKRMEFLNLLRQRLGTISTEREKELTKLHGAIIKFRARVEEARLETEQLTQKTQVQSPEYAVKIRDRLYRKVTVTIGHKKYFSASIKGHVTIYRRDDDLLVEPKV